ncbi:transcription factor c2h2 [Cyclospora cayetanensis]|uniref:Transcription factor c2h2 n=1 Tax=Cyclospora cayetanensis TaxID=88456 RepID=A0A1D3CVA7_9EIME|nr:transcription factor c2h2 [Cyclospora cayetanensis]
MAGESVGSHCSYRWCNQLDFLPFKCLQCGLVFCRIHYKQGDHECSLPSAPGSHEGSSETNVVHPTGSSTQLHQIVCRRCGRLLDVPMEESHREAILDRHRHSLECAAAAIKPSCMFGSCQQKSVSPACLIRCILCNGHFCLAHRHPEDHLCAAAAAQAEQPQQPSRKSEKQTLREQASASIGSSGLSHIVSGPGKKSPSTATVNGGGNKKLSAKAEETQKRIERMRVKMRAPPAPSIPSSFQLPLRVDLQLLRTFASPLQQQKAGEVIVVIDGSKTLGCALDRILEILKIPNTMASAGGTKWALLLPQQRQTAGAPVDGAASTGGALDLSKKAADTVLPGDTVLLCNEDDIQKA